jgi:hypothetical protein
VESSTPQTKAIILAHTYGVPADIVQLQSLCRQQQWCLIEVISECVGISVLELFLTHVVKNDYWGHLGIMPVGVCMPITLCLLVTKALFWRPNGNSVDPPVSV